MVVLGGERFLMSEVPLYMSRAEVSPYRGTSLTGKRTPPGPYRRPMPRVLRGSWGGGRFLMGEVPLYYSVDYGGVRPYHSLYCRGTSLKRNSCPLGTYSSILPRARWGPWGVGRETPQGNLTYKKTHRL